MGIAALPVSTSPRLVAPLETSVPRAPRIVAIGGGTGLPAVLEGLCAEADARNERSRDRITAVVTVTDDGGSSGRLRQALGVLPPGDVRNCIAAVADERSPFKTLLQHRFRAAEGLDGHPVGNLLLSALTQITGDFAEAVDRLGEMIDLRGRVMPTTSENVRLRAEMASGELVTGETAITSRRTAIRRLSLDPSPRPLPEVLRALVNADAIVVGPGSLYTSILPNLLVEGVASTLYGVDAVRIYVANVMTEPGETDGFSLDDHLRAIRTHVNFDLFDYILVNTSPIGADQVSRYASEGATVVERGKQLQWAGNATVVERDLLPECGGGKVRHNPRLLARAIRELVDAGRP